LGAFVITEALVAGAAEADCALALSTINAAAIASKKDLLHSLSRSARADLR